MGTNMVIDGYLPAVEEPFMFRPRGKQTWSGPSVCTHHNKRGGQIVGIVGDWENGEYWSTVTGQWDFRSYQQQQI